MLRYLPTRRVIRVSMSTLLFLPHPRKDLYLLYLEDHNQTTQTVTSSDDSYWAPIGGVLKKTDSEAWRSLEQVFDIHSMQVSESSPVEGTSDIRLYLPARKAIRFIWQLLNLVKNQRAVETPVGAMHRELIEEVVGDSKDPAAMLRLIQERSESYVELGASLLRLRRSEPVVLFKLDSKRPRHLMHLRLFYIVEPVDQTLFDMLHAAAAHEPERFLWATRDQIEMGQRYTDRRTNISDHAKAILEVGLDESDKINLEGVMPEHFEKMFRHSGMKT